MKHNRTLPSLGRHLQEARRARFPDDGVREFAARIGVSPGTLVKMQKGQLSVSLDSYFAAARVLGVAEQFETLFVLPKPLFDD